VDLRNVVGIFAVVDPEDDVPEYDEENNRAFLPVSGSSPSTTAPS
jgi:hypothetical protein